MLISPIVLLVIPPLGAGAFPFGVAAGDVTESAAILWTRADEPGEIPWELATDADFSGIVAGGVAVALAENDLTVHVEATGLRPDTTYYYRFRSAADAAQVSAAGTFRTPPGPDRAAPLRLVYSGDSEAGRRPFDMLGFAAEERPDVFLYVGDTIYADLTTEALGVAVTLDEYRAKYRENREDVHLRRLLASVSTWAVWDDHEVENDYSGRGLIQAGRGGQMEAGYRAFFEYMPVRRNTVEPNRTYRSFRWGRTAEFFLLDGRQYRDPGASDACGASINPLGFAFGSPDPACVERLFAPRSMLGAEQLAWLKEGLAGSTAAVKFVVTNVPISFVAYWPYDRWDGYDAERREILEFIDAHRIGNVVFLTTDFHANAYNPDVMSYFRRYRPDYRLDNGVICPEVITGPIAAASLHEEVTRAACSVLGLDSGSLLANLLVSAAESAMLRPLVEADGLTFAETNRYAYVVIDVEPDGALRTRFRGLATWPGQSPARVETMHEEPPPAWPSPCGLPLLPAVVALFAAAERFSRAGRAPLRASGRPGSRSRAGGTEVGGLNRNAP